MGELHLEIIVDRMKREFGVEANVGKPQVAYRETITASAPGKEIYKKQSGGRGKFGHVELEIEPAPGEGFVFEDKITGGSIPRQFIKPTMEGISDAMRRGFLAGYELVDIKATLAFRFVSRSRLGRKFIPHRRFVRIPGCGEKGKACSARADHEDRGRYA